MSVKKTLKFYILTSASGRYLDWFNRTGETDTSFKGLKCHFDPRWSNISYKDAVVVINTLDKDYERVVSQWCSEKGIEHYITESNGNPGKGKNELLKIFQESDNDYMVQIDGDDILTPYGVDLYKSLAKENAPDSIIIYHQWAQYIDRFGQRIYSRIMNNQDRPANYKKDYAHFAKYVPMMYNHSPSYRKKVKAQGGIDKVCDLYATYTGQVHELTRQFNETYFSHVTEQMMVDNHCRPVWYSKKAAKFRFDEEMRIGEDTRFYLHLKHAHYTGNLEVRRLKEIPCTYVYNNMYGGIVAEESNGMTNMDWMKLFMDNIDKDIKEGKVGKHPNLPELQISIPDEVNDYYITQEFNLEDLDPESEEYKNIKLCDETRVALKDRIKQLEDAAKLSMQKLVRSIIKPGERPRWAFIKDPFVPNIPYAVPQDEKMEHYFQKRIIE